jgi:Rrf2 family protein
VRLELTRRGDYAVRAMLALAEADAGNRRLSAAAIGERMRIPASYVAQVMAGLSRAGMARAARGRYGGYRLARPAADISLLDVVTAAERSGGPRSCVLRGSPCADEGTCQVHDAFAAGEAALLGALGRVTLEDVARQPAGTSPAADARHQA